MGRTSSITMPSMMVIVGREPVVDKKSVMFFCLLPAGLRVAQPCRYCFYSLAQKWVFRPAGTTRCLDRREIWNGGADRRSSSRAKFHIYCGRNVGIQPQNCQNFEFLP